MEENIYVQIYIFLFTLYGGLIIGILYDMIDILLHNPDKGYKGRGKTDILFWMLAMVVVLFILFYSNDGVIRVYTLLGFAVGWLLYFWLLSKLVQRLILFILQTIFRIFRILLSIILIPYKWIKSLLYIPMVKIYNKGSRIKAKTIQYLNIPRLIMRQFEKYKKYLKKKL